MAWPTTLRLVFAGLVATAAFLASGESPTTTGTAQQFTPPLETAREDEGELVRQNCRVHGKRIEPLVCAYGPKGSTNRVVLFGDSHAMQWGPALIPLAKKRGWRLTTLIRTGCPIANVVAESHCSRWREKALRKIESLRPKHIILSTSIGNRYRLKYQGLDLSRKDSEPSLRTGMIQTIRRLQRIDSLVDDRTAITLIRDQVMAPFVPAECLMKSEGRTDRCVFRNKRKFGPGFDWYAARRTGIGPAIDPTTVLCGRKWCSTTSGRVLKYRDSDHLTATYVRTLSGWLDDRLGIR
ncbi:MAG: hypothetical protein J0H66_08910 [Solirubrobacterales bacterium]|nr:hypothetical protein [Solirubrobacterales bacterium]OJU95805.1 MAG: hypothetical protein BGO23_09475 [Solirubrobacterales bacterium 67-14]